MIREPTQPRPTQAATLPEETTVLTETAADLIAAPPAPAMTNFTDELAPTARAAVTGRLPVAPPAPTSHMGLAAWPRTTDEHGHMVAIEAITPDAKALIAAIRETGMRQLADRLRAVRLEFFEQGIGREYRQQQERVAAAEKALKTARANVETIRGEWSRELASDVNEELERLEAALQASERDVKRWEARLPEQRAELERLKSAATEALAAAIAATIQTYKTATARNVWDAKVALAEATSAAFLAWLTKASEAAGLDSINDRTLREFRRLD